MPHNELKLNIIEQYKEEIQLAFREAYELGSINHQKLNELICRIWKYSKLEGITEEEFELILSESLPETYEGHHQFSWKKSA